MNIIRIVRLCVRESRVDAATIQGWGPVKEIWHSTIHHCGVYKTLVVAAAAAVY